MQILGDMWKSHGAPMAQQFCNEISAAYLQPALREAGFADWHMVVADYDAAQVVVKPDRSDDADKAAELVMIGPRGYRLMKNIPEDYAPSETEREDMLEVLGRKPEEDAPDEPRGDAAAEEGPPAPGPEGDSGRQTRVVTSSASEAMGAAMMALARCRELAGIRVRQKEKLCPECLQPAAGKPASLVASVLGPATLAQLDLDPLRLVRGGADTLKAVLMQWGYSDLQSGAICEMIEGFAARTLYDSRQPQLPTGFSAHLERARENGSALEN
jgi:hypothetical protein